jgi:hypothetical protein
MKIEPKIGDRVRFETYKTAYRKEVLTGVVERTEFEWKWQFWTTVVEIIGDDGFHYSVNLERVTKI